MAKYCFTTVASCDCLYKLLVMHRSLNFHNKDFILYVLCADVQSYKILKDLALGRVNPVKLDNLENETLRKVRTTRSFMEYCWTLKSVILLYALKHYKNAQYYIHLDSDLCFFSSIDRVFDEAPEASVFITDHNNSDEFLYTYESSGRFNSGFIGFKNDVLGRHAMQWWNERCLEWCYVTPDIEKRLYGDQRYLEWMYESFSNVHVIRNKGANAAHWNIKKYDVTLRDEAIYLDEDKLLFYHFSGFSILNPKGFILSWLTEITGNILNLIYIPYMILLSEEIKRVQNKNHNFDRGFLRIDPENCKHYYEICI